MKADNLHVSVSCVVIGFDGTQLCVLLVKGEGKQSDYKMLPTSLISEDDDLDEAAKRILKGETGLGTIQLLQFRAYGFKNMVNSCDDVRDLMRKHQIDPEQTSSVLTIAYWRTVEISKQMKEGIEGTKAQWVPVSEIGKLVCGQEQIVKDAVECIRTYSKKVPSLLFDMLPKEFTISSLRKLYSMVYDREYDVRNFYKKMQQMEYIVPLEKKQVGVSHRAARYFRFVSGSRRARKE
ncbi:MAG: NUDIX hydrolase [Phocaeicola sp.]|nr:NUDIX hydrolase [Phocaeicola sp.]